MSILAEVHDLIVSGNFWVAAQNRRRDVRRLYPNPPRRTTNWSARRLNSLRSALPGLDRYLEIGLAEGRTFEKVTAPQRVGVDPRPRFDTSVLPTGVHVYATTSDKFFAQNRGSFDLVFLDGFHTFQQTYRDLINSLVVCPSGPILVDDVVPADEVSAERDMKSSLEARARLEMPGQAWHGDVFRMVLCLRENHPELQWRTLLDDNPQLLVWADRNSDIERVSDATLEGYASSTYLDIFGNGVPDYFRPMREAEALADAVSGLKP